MDLPWEKRFTTRRPSSLTRSCCLRLSSIGQNSRLLPPVGVWAVLSPSLADHPLRPATDRRLGEPLPRQLANRTQAPPEAPFGFGRRSDSPTTCGISHPFGQLFPTSGQVTYALLSRPPLGKPPSKLGGSSFDLHVSRTPPAFVLSQDQTLRTKNQWSRLAAAPPVHRSRRLSR